MADLLGPFVESETAGTPILFWYAEDQVGRGNAITNGIQYALADAKDAVVIDEHGVVVPESSVRRNALMAVVGDYWGKASDLGCRGFWGQDDFVGKSGGKSVEVGYVG